LPSAQAKGYEPLSNWIRALALARPPIGASGEAPVIKAQHLVTRLSGADLFVGGDDFRPAGALLARPARCLGLLGGKSGDDEARRRDRAAVGGGAGRNRPGAMAGKEALPRTSNNAFALLGGVPGPGTGALAKRMSGKALLLSDPREPLYASRLPAPVPAWHQAPHGCSARRARLRAIPGRWPRGRPSLKPQQASAPSQLLQGPARTAKKEPSLPKEKGASSAAPATPRPGS
jgi:hypothetical protein